VNIKGNSTSHCKQWNWCSFTWRY